MREVKFRAWDGNAGYMVGSATIQYLTAQNISTLDESYYLENYDFMQYTGIKDVNSVEVYEGDIVRAEFTAPDDLFFASGKVIWSDGLCAWIVEDCFGEFEGINDWGRGIEVIGNIHENPELLEQEQ